MIAIPHQIKKTKKHSVGVFDHSVTCRYFEVGQFELHILYNIAREESNDGIFARFYPLRRAPLLSFVK